MIITIYSRNGGTGKTTIAITLANIFTYMYKKNVELCTLHEPGEVCEGIRNRDIEDHKLDSTKLYPIHRINGFSDIEKFVGSEEIIIVDMNSPVDIAIIEQSDLVLLPVINTRLDLVSILEDESFNLSKSYVVFNQVPAKYQEEQKQENFFDEVREIEETYKKEVKYSPFIYTNRHLCIEQINTFSASTMLFDAYKPLVDFIIAKFNWGIVS